MTRTPPAPPKVSPQDRLGLHIFIAMGRANVTRSADRAGCVSYARSVLPHLPNLTSLSIVDLFGAVVCGTFMRDVALNVGDLPYFQETMTSADMVTGEYIVGRGSHRPVLCR